MSSADQSRAFQPDPEAGAGGSAVHPLRAPYLIYFGDVQNVGHAKTGLGLIHWRRENCAGQMRLDDCRVDGGLKDMDIEEAFRAGVKSVLIGVAPAGGAIPAAWLNDLAAAAEAGLDIISGMHTRLSAYPRIAAAARTSGARLINVRTPPVDIPVGTGAKRSGKRLLTVGTDCAVGKKYTALAIEQEMRARGLNADFRATGQTGIMIAGSGIAIDSVVSDFISGAAEMLSPPADKDHWDIIEGQGALTHPSFAGVSLGLLHGSQPDAVVLCHDPARDVLLGVDGAPRFPVLPVRESLDLCLELGRRVNPDMRAAGISLNTSRLSGAERARLSRQYASQTGLPVIDPLRDGVGAVVDYLETEGF